MKAYFTSGASRSTLPLFWNRQILALIEQRPLQPRNLRRLQMFNRVALLFLLHLLSPAI